MNTLESQTAIPLAAWYEYNPVPALAIDNENLPMSGKKRISLGSKMVPRETFLVITS